VRRIAGRGRPNSAPRARRPVGSCSGPRSAP
jgi:hypothetical protein